MNNDKNIVAQLERVDKSYHVGKVRFPALKNFTLTVRKGEFIALIGPSGCGKSTALNIIGCMDTPSKGNVTVLGHDILTVNDTVLSHLRRERVGFIFQNFNLLPVLNCLENIMYPLILKNDKDAKKKAMQMLVKVGMEKFAKSKPNELSGGQRQRCAIARAFASSNELIIADEPTANLDSKNSEQILELILGFIAEYRATFITVSHHKEFYRRADRVMTMKDGTIVDTQIQKTL